MADRNIYLGNASDKAIEPSKIYIGDANDKAQLVSKIYVGNESNKAVQVWPKMKWNEIYQKCEYLYNTGGTEYIILNKKPDSNTRVVISAQFMSHSQASYDYFVISAGDAWGIANYFNGAQYVRMRFNQSTSSATGNLIAYNMNSLSLWNKHTYDFNRSGGYFYVDSTNIGRLQNTFSTLSYNIRLWTVNPSGTWGSVAKAYIYSCQIYQGNELIYDLVPCYRKNDIKPGMYDFANDYFYTNAGSGEFYKGPDVN